MTWGSLLGTRVLTHAQSTYQLDFDQNCQSGKISIHLFWDEKGIGFPAQLSSWISTWMLWSKKSVGSSESMKNTTYQSWTIVNHWYITRQYFKSRLIFLIKSLWTIDQNSEWHVMNYYQPVFFNHIMVNISNDFLFMSHDVWLYKSHETLDYYPIRVPLLSIVTPESNHV